VKYLTVLFLGFMFGVLATGWAISFVVHGVPSTPPLRPATAIQVVLYPSEYTGGPSVGVPISIPPENLDFVFRLVTPESYYGKGMYEFIAPMMAKVEITHADGARTRILVRDGGHNPAVVTLDGSKYFYARNDPEVTVGAFQLCRLVAQIANEKKTEQQSHSPQGGRDKGAK